ncbi:MAG: para-aminobenzoate synthetase component 1 [Arcticibacterium sp.]|jgi:para-aminobenzoate synthetase component 1
MSKRKSRVFSEINKLGKSRTPFIFITDFDLNDPFVIPLHALDSEKIRYSMNDNFLEYRNYLEDLSIPETSLKLQRRPLSFTRFERAFNIVWDNLKRGNSFLTNLTAESSVSSNWDLETVFQQCKSKYKLYWKDKFLCFSPETFVQIDEGGKISSFPMKGTIDADIQEAESIILDDAKEKYEHTTIVDLIRNDLSKVADKVWVERFRYLERINKEDGSALLQVSSEVCGQLKADWKDRIGDILFDLLPAGSISGAPKPKTLEIIKEAEKLTFEGGSRGYYTGVFGVFDGEKMNSAVMIRFIEQRGEKLVFKSGGGITFRSDAQKEFEELISKIYVPVF